MPNRDESIQNFCREIVDYINSSNESTPEISEDTVKQASPQVLTLIKKTQIKVVKEIQQLIESGEQVEKLLNLYMIDQTLYNLHHQINKTEIIVAKNLYQAIKNEAKRHLKLIKKKRNEATKRYKRRLKINSLINLFCYPIGIASAFAGISYPDDVTFYLTITFLCIMQLFLFSNFWINGAKAKRDEVFQKYSSDSTKKAFKFLTPGHLITLLEPPSFAPRYHERFFKMLVQLAISYGWVPKKDIDVEDMIENGKKALEDAYSTQPTTFDPEYIEKWRKNFEEIQLGLHQRFGNSLYSFNLKTKETPSFYFEQYSAFKSSKLGENLHRFLKKTEYL